MHVKNKDLRKARTTLEIMTRRLLEDVKRKILML